MVLPWKIALYSYAANSANGKRNEMKNRLFAIALVVGAISACSNEDAKNWVYVDFDDALIKERSLHEFKLQGVEYTVDGDGKVYVSQKHTEKAILLVQAESDRQLPRDLSISVEAARHSAVIAYLDENNISYREVKLESGKNYIVFNSEKDLNEFNVYFEKQLRDELMKSLNAKDEGEN